MGSGYRSSVDRPRAPRDHAQIPTLRERSGGDEPDRSGNGEAKAQAADVRCFISRVIDASMRRANQVSAIRETTASTPVTMAVV